MPKTTLPSLLAALLLTACAGTIDTSPDTTSSSSGGGGSGGASPDGGLPGSPTFLRFSESLAWCATRGTGEVVCWQPVLGVEDTQPNAVMTTVPGVNDATSVAVQFYAACALRASGKVACWGTNEAGELLSIGAWDTVITTATDLPGVEATAVSSALHSTCILRKGGQVACFGGGSATPVAVPGVADARAIAGGTLGCAVRASGSVACWVGIGAAPATVAGVDDAIETSVSDVGACALHASGEVSCWNWGEEAFATKVPGFQDEVRLKVGLDRVCALDAGGSVKCWTWWNGSAEDTPIHDAVDIGHDYSQLCVIHASGKLECGGVSGE
jgi:hypothetical protein